MEFQKVNKSAGRISPTPMGDYDDTTTYRRLDWVYYGGTSYICKKNNTLGIKPSNPERWQKIIDEIGDMKIVFTEAGERKLFTSGENLSVIIGKIKKFISDLKTVAFTGKYSDLTGQPQSLKNPQALNIKYNGTTQVNYDGSETKEINITPANIGAPATSAVLTTTEQITANTSTGNIAGALAAKAMMADYNNKINQINSNLAYKMSTGGYYGGDTGLNDIKNVGFSRKWISTASDDGKYLGFGGSCLIINSMSAGYLFQIIFSVDGTGGLAWRRNMVQNDYTFSYDTPLFRAQLMN